MKNFKLSAFADESSGEISGQIANLKKNEIRFIELRTVNGRGFLDHPKENLLLFKKMFEDEGIHVSALGSPIGKIAVDDPFEPHIELFKRTLEAAGLLETKRIRMFSFFIPKEKDPAQFQEAVIERLSVLLDLASSCHILCCLENEKDLYGDTGPRSLALLRHFKGKLKGIFDPANYIQSGETPADIFDSLHPYIDYMHIKDARREDGSVVPAGYGDGGFPEILEKLSVGEGEMFLSIEPHLRVFPGFDTLRDSHLKNHFHYESAEEAFSAAADALKHLLNKGGYRYE